MDEGLIAKLVEAVGDYYNADPPKPPLLLSRFGQLHKDLRQELIDAAGSLGSAIRAAGPERLLILRTGGKSGGEVVVTPEKREQVEAVFAERASHSVGAEQSLHALPFSMQVAFCTRTESGQLVALQLNPPHRYQKLSADAQLPPGLKAVEDRFRHPEINVRSATPAQKETLWGAISAWATSHGIDLGSFIERTSRESALSRLLAAQPRAILSQLVIPGDILELLLRHE